MSGFSMVGAGMVMMPRIIKSGYAVIRGVAALIALATPCFAGGAADVEAGREQVATVNEVGISQDEFNSEFERLKRGTSGSGIRIFTPVRLREIRREALDNLVRRELLLQESRKKGVVADLAAVDEELAKLKGRFANEIEFSTTLSSLHLSEPAIRNVVERGLAIRGYIDSQFGRDIVISEEEKKAYYRSHSESFSRPLQFRISHILIRTAGLDEKGKSAALEKIEGIRARLRQGEQFSQLAQTYSQCGSSAQGGDLGFFKRGEMARQVEEAVLALRSGETSGVVEDRFGYHLIRLDERKEEKTVNYAAAEGKIAEYLRREKALERANRYIDELRKKARVEIALPDGD